MHVIKNIALMSVLVSGLANAEKLQVNLSGSFYAPAGHSIGLGEDKSAFVYSVYGASNLTISLKTAAEQKLRVSVECLGFDELGNKEGTQGVGRCVWIDESNDKLFASISTKGETNQYKITGGTGKWKDSTGTLNTHFVYLPTSSNKFYLGTDDGKGTISAPNYK
ncbi:hypothetical protein [Pseudocolwellia agarivorans]|uniref:hypothetical protein n=1 Tax=Pseudocolwellia agarivorans TaxID=1911682 RepID=UPI0009863F2F|nr:hypothetical protein [Pseudocolwellia agarivorans]